MVDRALRWALVASVVAAGSLLALSCGSTDELPLVPSNTDASRGGTATESGGSAGESGGNNGGTGTSGTGTAGTGVRADASGVDGSGGASGAQGAGATSGSGGTGGQSAGAGGVGGVGGFGATHDASGTDSNTATDGNTAADGNTADSSVPPSFVACGATASCPTNPGRCCWDGSTATCQGVSACPWDAGFGAHTEIDCDGSEDCPTGQVCCVRTGSLNLISVKCASACSGLMICNPANGVPGDCLNGATCRPHNGSATPPGYHICGV